MLKNNKKQELKNNDGNCKNYSLSGSIRPGARPPTLKRNVYLAITRTIIYTGVQRLISKPFGFDI